MAKTKRAQVLMEPAEYRQLADIARGKDCSVADLVREAVREKYFTGTADKRQVVDRIAKLNLPIDEDWDTLKEEIEGQGEDVH